MAFVVFMLIIFRFDPGARWVVQQPLAHCFQTVRGSSTPPLLDGLSIACNEVMIKRLEAMAKKTVEKERTNHAHHLAPVSPA